MNGLQTLVPSRFRPAASVLASSDPVVLLSSAPHARGDRISKQSTPDSLRHIASSPRTIAVSTWKSRHCAFALDCAVVVRGFIQVSLHFTQ
ncbi:MAG TPA: hypothetical protein VGE08_17990 [Steroidobacter sp.]|uniref:hypothetical protein n=1 Tax=Steroidobacter sp. TaxID=1978227 RepID=UPI002EDBB84E